MLYLIVPEKIMGSYSTYAILPVDAISPSVLGNSFKNESKKDVLPEPTLPIMVVT